MNDPESGFASACPLLYRKLNHGVKNAPWNKRWALSELGGCVDFDRSTLGMVGRILVNLFIMQK